MPLAAELVQAPVDAEFMTQSPSQTVSIYEALAEILSKPTESLNLSNSKSTDRTLFSEAPISSTTTSTTTTTTSTTPVPTTTEAKDDLKVENSTLDGLDIVESVNTARVNNQETSTEAPTTETVSEFTTNSDNLTTTLNYSEPPLSTPISFSLPQAETTRNPSNDLKIKTTTEEEFLTSTIQTTFNDLAPTNNFKSFENVTNAFNKTGIETTEMNLQLDQNQSSLKQEKIVSPSIIKTNSFMKVLTTSTVPPDYSPRFSESNRIPILSFGVLREERKIEPTTNSNKIDLMTKKVTQNVDDNNSYTTPSVYPVYRPEVETTTDKTNFNKTENTSTKILSHEDTKVMEAIATSSFTTLTEVETTTVFNAEDFFTAEISTQTFNSPSSTIAYTTTEPNGLKDQFLSADKTTEILTERYSETSTLSLDKNEIFSTTPVDTTARNFLHDETTLTLFSKNFTSESSNASDFSNPTNQSSIDIKSLIEEINELTTVTDSPKITTEPSKLNFSVDPISIEKSTVNPFAPAPFKPQPKQSKSLFPKPHPRKPDSSKIKERVVYAILSNNTVIRKTIQERLTTENPYVIYGIFPNNSVVRKFRNGTLVPDDITTHIEITNIDPKSLINANSEFHKQSSETVLEHSAIISTTNLPITDQTKTVFYLLISILNSFAQK